MSQLPHELRSALTSADLSLAESGDGHLQITARRRIWDSMGPYRFDADQFARGVGHLRRTTLACFAAEAALGVWEQLGGDNEPDRVLALIEAFLVGKISSAELFKVAEHMWRRVDSMQEGPESWVLFATYHAVNVAFSDELVPAGMQAEEDALSDYDSGYYASCAIANGHPGDPDSSVDRRRAFWTWYIESAIPAAHSIVRLENAD